MELKLPFDEQLEREILACCLTDDTMPLLSVRAILEAGDFHLELHRRVFMSLCRIAGAGGALLYTAIYSDMEARGQEISLGWLADLDAPSAPRWALDRHLQRQQELARRRALARQAFQLFHDAQDLTIPLDDLTGRAQASLRDVYGQSASEAEDVTAIIQNAGGIGEFLKPRHGIMTPWPMFDHIAGGWQAGDLVLIGARPSMGKTALALEALHHAAEHGTPSVLYSYEMTRESLVMRLISRRTGIPFMDILRGELSATERWSVRTAIEALSAMPLRIVGASGKSVLAIRVHAERLRHRGQCDLAAVDYIGLIHGAGMEQRGLSRNHELGEICRQLKEMAGSLGIPLLVLSQLSRAPEGRTDKRPVMSDLRDSGDLESHADLIAFLHRPGYYNREDASLRLVAEMIIGKQRNGDTPIIPLEFFRECGRFSPARQQEAA